MKDEEFLPDVEEKEMKHQQKLESTLIVPKKPDDMLKHNVESGGILFKYDLPVENQPLTFRSQLIVKEDLENTPLENLYENLDIDKDSSYESFIIKLNQNYNNEIDMYGDVKKAGESHLKVSFLI